MALIKCPECGKEISNKATACPNCGCPITSEKQNTTVRIKLPNLQLGLVGLFSSRAATIYDSENNILWQGKHGENAKFDINADTSIRINIGGWANEITGIVEKGKKYSCVQDLGVHMLATYRLTEVDYIDAD